MLPCIVLHASEVKFNSSFMFFFNYNRLTLKIKQMTFFRFLHNTR